MAHKPHHPPDTTFSAKASAAAGIPPTYYVFVGPMGGTANWISLPQAGNLWVAYEFQSQQVAVTIWHQGGQTTNVLPGINNPPYPVGANDALTWSAPTDGSSIKLGWQYV